MSRPKRSGLHTETRPFSAAAAAQAACEDDETDDSPGLPGQRCTASVRSRLMSLPKELRLKK